MNCHFNAESTQYFSIRNPKNALTDISPYIYHGSNDALHGIATPKAWDKFGG